MIRMLLKTANFLLNLVLMLCLCVAGAYATYALWDNNQIYSAASNVQLEMEKIKPEVEEDGEASFEELLEINPDVRAWLTLDGTAIDYPVLQGANNLTYLNTDVYGNFALAGSIYMDSRNAADCTDAYVLLYGHHMESSRMFGDLDLYKDSTFFAENSTGKLILPDRSYDLEIFACLVVGAGEDNIFDTDRWKEDIQGLLTFAGKNSLLLREETMKLLEDQENPQILACSTCSSEFTDARTIILAVMIP